MPVSPFYICVPRKRPSPVSLPPFDGRHFPRFGTMNSLLNAGTCADAKIVGSFASVSGFPIRKAFAAATVVRIASSNVHGDDVNFNCSGCAGSGWPFAIPAGH